MKLVKQEKVFQVKTHYECEGYGYDNCHKLKGIEDVLRFLNNEPVEDINGSRCSYGYYEIVYDICELVEYEIDYEHDKEYKTTEDYSWKVEIK